MNYLKDVLKFFPRFIIQKKFSLRNSSIIFISIQIHWHFIMLFAKYYKTIEGFQSLHVNTKKNCFSDNDINFFHFKSSLIISPWTDIFLMYFIDYAITVVPFPPLYSTPSCTPPPTHIPHL